MNAYLPGDIAACYGTDFISRTIRWATFSPWAPRGLRLGPSHVALLCEYRHSMLWVESTTLTRHACLIAGRPVAGVQAHWPSTRIDEYVAPGGRVELYRLTSLDRLSADESQLLTALLMQHFLGRGIDYDTRGALLSGTRVLKFSRLFRAGLESVFCSELIAAVLQRLGRMNRANPTRYNPAGLLRELVQTGVYERVTTWTPTSPHMSDNISIEHDRDLIAR